MATTVTSATLTSTITETITLNGQAYGNTATHEVVAQGQAYTRLHAVPTGAAVEILNLGAADSAGTIVGDKLVYFRITNLDDTNYILLSLFDAGGVVSGHKIRAGESFVLMSNQIADGAAALGDITSIKAVADTLECDIEFTTVTE